MAKTEIAVAELVWNLIAGRKGNIGRVTYFPQKPAFGYENGCMESSLERSTPESQGISSGHLASFLRELGRTEGTDIHQVLVARHGQVICECGYGSYPAGLWHASYSLCKSITGMAIGMLVQEGALKPTDRVIDFFKKRHLLNVLRQKDITVENLLTMTSCVAFNESGILSGDDWVRGFMESGLMGTPGRDFQYNSMNTYLLSAIVTEVTGETMMEYLRPRLWEPLGIAKVFWETCPMGITKGGWGLFLRPEDAAKLGMLYLQRGKWKDKQIISEEWAEQSCRKHSTPQPEMGNYGYGYQMWMAGKEGSFNYNGMLGQNVVVYPDNGLIVVTNAGSRELFQNCRLMGVVRKYFEEGFEAQKSLPENPREQAALYRTIQELGGGQRGPGLIRRGGWRRMQASSARKEMWTKQGGGCGEALCWRGIRFLDGKWYEMQEDSVGLMPLLMQVMHNNYTDGIRRVGFSARKGRFYLGIQEGEEINWMEIGFSHAVATDVSFHGEIYRLGIKGEFSKDEEGRLVLLLDFAFLEEACRRKGRMYFDNNGMEIRWDETPGKDVIMDGLGLFTDMEGKMGILMNAVRESGGVDVFRILVERTIQPVCRGVQI